MMQLNAWIRSHKIQIAVALLSFIGLLHLALFLYTSTPSQLGFDFGWNESNDLYVIYVHPDRKETLAVGDVIQEVNGVVPIRGTFNMPNPLPDNYQLKILRENKVFSTTYHAIEPSPRFLLDIYISVIMWALGVAILFVTKSTRWGIAIGGGYIVWALVWLGILTTDSAVSWYANALVFPLVAPLLISSAFYYHRPLSPMRKRTLLVAFGISTLFGVANVWEQFYLFPKNTNIESLLGFRLEYLILFGTAVAFLFLLFALIRRFRQLEQSFEKQSIAIILIFAVLGIVPFFVLVIVPVLVSGTPWINPTICYALMAFIPLGFLCAIWREQSTNLERILTRIVLASSITIIGMLFLLAIERVTQFGDPRAILNSAMPAIFLGTVIALYPRTPFLRVLDRLIYGPQKVGRNHLNQLTQNLTAEPTWGTVSRIIANLAVVLDLDGLAVYLRTNRVYDLVATTNSTFQESLPYETFPSHLIPRFHHDVTPTLMQSVSERTEIGYVPMTFSGSSNGILLVNYSNLGNIDANTMTILREVANLLAIGIPAIMVHAAVDEDQAAALYSRELERRNLADELHDGPLQNLIYLKTSHDLVSVPLEKIIATIRRICTNLHDPILDFAPKIIVSSIVQEHMTYFADGIGLTVEIEDGDEYQMMSEQGNMALKYITSESLNNALKYANVAFVAVYLCIRASEVEVVVSDQGRGFEPPEQFVMSGSGGLGLKNMRRWAKLAKGKLNIASAPGNGTTITTTLPF